MGCVWGSQTQAAQGEHKALDAELNCAQELGCFT